jgi:pimeloyl-ACP methyl ester carboxylesterase
MLTEYPWEVNGTLTRVLEAGRDGVPTVLLHGVGARADRWRQNLEPLADAGLHLFAIDLPGHGFAGKGSGFADYSAAGCSAFVRGFLDSIGVERAAVIGTSLGGHVAGRLTCDSPERVLALVMVGAVGLVPLGGDAREAVATSLANVTVDGIRAKLTRVLHDSSLITDEWVLEESRINSSPGAAASFEAFAAWFRADADRDLVGDRLAALADPPPMLLVWGREDQIVTISVGEQAHELLGDRASFRTIDSTGHAPYLEAPSEFNEIVTTFLRSSRVLPGPDQPQIHKEAE